MRVCDVCVVCGCRARDTRRPDTDGAGAGDLEGLVVRTVLFRLLRHEADVGDVAHGGGVELAVGAKVEANWLGHSTWYAATVSAKRADGTYNLTYDDGACEDKVHADRIRNRAAATTVSGVEAAGVELFT